MLRSSTSASNVARSFRAVQHQNIVLIAEATVISEITSAAVQAGPKKKSVSVTESNSIANPAHQSHKVSGVSHYTTVSVLQDSHPLSATMQTGIPPCGGMNAIVASVRRAFTEACAAVQNGCMKSREFYLTFASICCSALLIKIWCLPQKTGAHSRRVLCRPRAPVRLCNVRLFCSRL